MTTVLPSLFLILVASFKDYGIFKSKVIYPINFDLKRSVHWNGLQNNQWFYMEVKLGNYVVPLEEKPA